MSNGAFRPLAGSDRSPVPGARPVGPVEPQEQIELTLLLRRRTKLPDEVVEGGQALTSAEFAARYGSDPGDVERVRTALERYGVQVLASDPASRRVTVAGPADALATAFGTSLAQVVSTNPVTGQPLSHRQRQGQLQVPADVDGVVLAVLGMDDRPQADIRLRLAAADAQVSYTPPQLGTVYRFPPGTDGSGQILAIVELGGGFDSADLTAYFAGLALPTPSVTAVGVDGATNRPGQDPTGADAEVLLDIETAGALAPGARQLVYFVPNTDRGFLDAVATATHASPTPTAISISWGGPEDGWTAQARTALDQALADAAALGVTVCVAAGDGGSSDGQPDRQPHVDFPAGSPHALACGGTSLDADAGTGTVTTETVWNDGPGGGATGGGVSTVFGLPSWQANVAVPARPGGGTGRGVPDVAADADPATGYRVRIDGQPTVVGGTSAVAPLWAALVCRLAQGLGRRPGLLQPLLYATAAAGTSPAGFRDITSGNNGDYSAGPGWDACTGLGVPVGTALLTALSAAPAAGTPPHGGAGTTPAS